MRKLCELIDNQDLVALMAFLHENQDLELNNVTASGCSALWYALTVPKGKKPSLDIIQTLIDTRRINPTLTYNNLRYDVLSLSPSIMQAIKTYEDQYQHTVRPGQAEENNLNRLAQVALDSQNTHDPVVVKGVDDSVIRLLKRYNLNETAINLQITALMDFIKDIKNKTEINIDLKAINDALTAIGRINRDNTTRDYKLSADETRNLTNSAVLALMFQAASDQDANNFVSGAEMFDAEILERKLRLIKHLAKSQNEYGNDSAACWMGTRNQMVSSLDMTHVDIRIAEETSLTPSIIAMKYRAFCQEKLKNLEERNGLYFEKYLRYYALRDLPGVGKFEGVNTDIPSDIKQFVQNIQKEFTSVILKENSKTKKPLIDSDLKKIYADLFQDVTYSEENNLHFTLNDTGHRAIAEFRRLAEIANVAGKSTSIAELIPTNKFQDLRQIAGKHLAEKVTSLKQSLIDEVNLDKLYEYVTSHPIIQPKTPDRKEKNNWDEYQKGSLCTAIIICKSLLDHVDSSKKSDILKKIWPKMLEALMTGADVKPSEKVLWETIQDHLSEVEPDISNWLTALPDEVRIVFFKKLFDEELLPDFSKNKEAIKEKALTLALDSGYFKGLNFQKLFTLKDKDLRGKDFCAVDLSNLVFENCDLRLTNIERNPTLSAAHLKNNILSMPSALYEILKIPKHEGGKSDPSLLKALLDNPHITRKECMTYLEKFEYGIFLTIHPDPLIIGVLAQHKKTQSFFEKSRRYPGDFIDAMYENTQCFEAGLSSPYYETPDGIRTLQAGIKRLEARTKNNNGVITYENAKYSVYNPRDQARILKHKNENEKIVIAIEKITEKLSGLELEKHSEVIKKPISEPLSPTQIYNATTTFCSEYTGNVVVPFEALTSQGREQWIHSVLNNQGEEVGRLVYPNYYGGNGLPHIIYFPGVVSDKDRETCGVPLLSDVKKFVDKKLMEDYPELDFTKAIGHYTLVVGRNQYVAGVSQNGHLDVQGYSPGDKVRSYSDFQKAVGCTERSYTPCNDKEILETKHGVLSSHKYLLDTNHGGYSNTVGKRLGNAHFSASDFIYPSVLTRKNIFSSEPPSIYIEKKFPGYPNANSFNQTAEPDRINNLTYEDAMKILSDSQDRNLIKRIIIQLANDIPQSEITAAEKIEQLNQIFNLIEKSSVLKVEQGGFGRGFFSQTGHTVGYQESIEKVKQAVLIVLKDCTPGDLSKEDVDKAKSVLNYHSGRLPQVFPEPSASSVHLKKHEDYLREQPKIS